MDDAFSGTSFPSGENQIIAPTTREREAAIFLVLRQPEGQAGLSVREIAEAAKSYFLHGLPSASGSPESPFAHTPKNDSVTVQAYHKLVGRLVALGRLEEAPPLDGQHERRYRLALSIHPANPLTLDDLYELALQPGTTAQLPPSEVIARAANAQDYLGERKRTVLKEAAVALTREDPRDLIFSMVKHYFDVLQHDLSIYSDRDLRDPEIKSRIAHEARALDTLLYRMLGIPPEVVDITGIRHLIRDSDAGRAEEAPQLALPSEHSITMDAKALRDFLKRRVFGEQFINRVGAGSTRGSASRRRLTVAGSDGSTHASMLQVRTARAYTDEGETVVTFNNAMVYVHQSSSAPYQADYPFHSVPITRSALDNPVNHGMILARQMFPDLEDAEYEHLARCATDVVQWRVDADVFSGVARPINPANIIQRQRDFTLPAPAVHFRDGTVVPQEREFGHYRRSDAYGDMVREGQTRMRSILQRLRSEDNKQVFAGAVKSTQMRLFSRTVSWYIAHGSKDRIGAKGKAIDPTWEEKYAAGFSDNQTMTYLLASLVEGREEEARSGTYWVSCAILRPFHATTEYCRQRGVETDEGWKRFFRGLAAREEQSSNDRGEPWLWETQDWEDDSFVYLCRRADFGMFYIGHTGGDPPPALPRYEFLDSLRTLRPDQAAARVADIVRRIVEAIDHTHVAIDSDHNFLTNKRLVKIIPYVVQRAHEACKTLGRQLESELRAAVIAQLSALRRLRGLTPNDVALLPMNRSQYVQQMTEALRKEEDEDPGASLR
jgi:hypothetical protein